MQRSKCAPARFAAVILACILAPAVVSAQVPDQASTAQPSAPSAEDARIAEMNAAWQAGAMASMRGPADIPLIDQAVLKLSADYAFIPKAQGTRIMRALGNVVGDSAFVGLIVGTHQNDEWIVVATYIKQGYIKDDDAKTWNADELLQNLKDGNVAANRDRVARGFPEVEVLGWVERPAYDAESRQLVWSLLSKLKGEPDSAEKGINYNTYALGRDGYLSLNLLTSSNRINADKVVAHELLGALSYNSGKRYEDFNAGTDRIAEYGLAALVGGVVAKKLGLLAVIGVFAAKFAKVIALAVAGFGAGIFKLFRRKPKPVSPES